MSELVCVVGSINWDLTLDVADLPRPGETVLASALAYAPGGKGGNQAVAAARAGACVRFIGAVGDDPAGDRLIEHLRGAGVGVDAVIRRHAPSGTAIIVVDAGGENTIVVAPGANSALSVSPTSIADCDVLLTQLEIPVSTALAAARQARSAGAVVMVNASPAGQDEKAVAELAGVADVVIANEHEARLWPWRSEHFVVTLGARGARYLGVDGEFEVPAPAVAAVDTTGAGAMYSRVCWPRVGRLVRDLPTDGARRCGGRVRQVRWRRWCAARVIAHRTPPRSTRLLLVCHISNSRRATPGRGK